METQTGVTTMTIQEKIQMMRDAGLNRRTDRIWQNANGTWSNHKDAQRQWTDKVGCQMDLRFADEWDAVA
jgi:hypothetical protein